MRILQDSQTLDARALYEALWRATSNRTALVSQFLDSIAIDRNVLTTLLRAPGYVEVQRVEPAASLMAKLPPELAMRLLAVPIEQHDDEVVVAFADARDMHAQYEIAFHLGLAVRPVYAEPDEIVRAVMAFERPEESKPRGPLQTPLWASPSIPEIDQTHAPVVVDEPVDIPFPLVARKARRRMTDMPVDLGPTDRPADLAAELGDRLLTIEELLRMPIAGGAALVGIRTREAIYAEIVRETSTFASRVALFLVKPNEIRGWGCNVGFGAAEALTKATLPYPGQHALTKAIHRDGFLGAIDASPQNAPLFQVALTFSSDVAVWPIFVDDMPTLIVVADGLVDTMLCTKRLTEIAEHAGRALRTAT